MDAVAETGHGDEGWPAILRTIGRDDDLPIAEVISWDCVLQLSAGDSFAV